MYKFWFFNGFFKTIFDKALTPFCKTCLQLKQVLNAKLLIFQCSKHFGSPTHVTRLKVAANMSDPTSMKHPVSSFLQCQTQQLQHSVPQRAPNFRKEVMSSSKFDIQLREIKLTLVLRNIFPEHIFRKGVATPPTIIKLEGHITLNVLSLYSNGCPLSIDTKISTIH